MFVYGLFDPKTPGLIRYVGACVDLERRLELHNHSDTDDARGEWIRDVKAGGRTVRAVALAYATSIEEANRLERHYIEHFKSLGWPLVNSTSGGASGFKWSERSRQKMSESQRGNTIRRGSKHRPESIEKMRAARTGTRHTAQTKEKMRLAHLGKKYRKRR